MLVGLAPEGEKIHSKLAANLSVVLWWRNFIKSTPERKAVCSTVRTSPLGIYKLELFIIALAKGISYVGVLSVA